LKNSLKLKKELNLLSLRKREIRTIYSIIYLASVGPKPKKKNPKKQKTSTSKTNTIKKQDTLQTELLTRPLRTRPSRKNPKRQWRVAPVRPSSISWGSVKRQETLWAKVQGGFLGRMRLRTT
jgi:hypothetical protein